MSITMKKKSGFTGLLPVAFGMVKTSTLRSEEKLMLGVPPVSESSSV